ncbi:MAG: FAD binding domain-containing protein [Chloroflexota bacterium]
MAMEWDAPAETPVLMPASLAEALALLAAHGEDARLLAGGQSLLVLKRLGLVSPSALISLQRAADLRGVAADGGALRIGAMTTQREIEGSARIRAGWTALAEAAGCVASPLIRRRSTIGGNLCHADPTGDPPAALIALGAVAEIVSAAGPRALPVEALFADYMETVLAPGEILAAVRLPAPPPRFGSAYVKHRLRGVDTALAGAGAGIALAADGSVASARIGVVGGGPVPYRAAAAERHLEGAPPDDGAIAAAAALAAGQAEPFSDTEASDWYRREMIEVMTRRALRLASDRAAGRETNR